MLSPTVGRVVWIHRAHGSHDAKQPEVGLVLYVHDDRHINVEGFSATGHPFTILNCPLLQDGDPAPEGDFAVWMPYQKGQAAKTEAVQQTLQAFKPDYGKFESPEQALVETAP